MLTSALLLVCFSVTPVAAQKRGRNDKTITQVVKLLEDMMRKSKSDGTDDRTIYAKFKCYCDSTTEEKNNAIDEGTDNIQTSQSFLASLRASNTKLSQEVATLNANLAANVAARDEATGVRNNEKTAFEAEEADLEAGIRQLDSAITLLAAVGADQTVSGDTESALMTGSFMAKKTEVKLTDKAKAAVNAASVFLSGDDKTKIAAFLQAPTGNYNAQSGEIVGVLKTMNDTFSTNLESARREEAKAAKEFSEMISLKTTEWDDMDGAVSEKSQLTGDQSAEIATTTSEVETMQNQLDTDQAFLAQLTTRCEGKRTEFEQRNALRANEEAAIAEAISILNSDAAFASFGETETTSAGRSISFIQTSHPKNVRSQVIASLVSFARSSHSLKVARVIAALSAENPFTKVLAMINKTITSIDAEEEDDVKKKDACETQQTEGGDKVTSKGEEIAGLENKINGLEISIEDSQGEISVSSEDLDTNRKSQASTTATRNDQNAQFKKSLKNLQDAEKILAKSIEVLTKYYKYLDSHNAEKTYVVHDGVDAGGGNMMKLDGKTVTELENACNADPVCIGFNSAGWLKSVIAPEAEWYSWDDGKLYIKQLNAASFVQLKEEPDEGPIFSKGQSTDGNKAIEMIKFIAGETTKEKETAIATEQSAVEAYNGEMEILSADEKQLVEDIASYKLDEATSAKQLEEAHEDLTTTKHEKAAVERFLEQIEPGCTFIQANYESRKTARANEKTALSGAIATLEATPAFQEAKAAAEREALGKCAPVCEEKGNDHAECGACQEGTTVFGWCSHPNNQGAAGCDTATATSSAAALS